MLTDPLHPVEIFVILHFVDACIVLISSSSEKILNINVSKSSLMAFKI